MIEKVLPIGKERPFAPLYVRKTEHMQHEQKNPIAEPLELVAKDTLLGIELELEGFYKGSPTLHKYWRVVTDHSLRDNGLEFTTIPLRAKQVEHALDYLFKRFEEFGTVPKISNRCSTHVHLNVRDLTWDQVRCLLVLYSIFERHFFYIAGTKRESNIFCVPMYKYKQSQSLLNVGEKYKVWNKYSALNVGTILGNEDVKRYGTIEFRHLYGTTDKAVIINWINNILMLRKAALAWTLEDLLAKLVTLNTTSEYALLYNQVFGKYAKNHLMIKYDFEHCVTMTKLNIFTNPPLGIKASNKSRLVTKFAGQGKALNLGIFDDVVKATKQKHTDFVTYKVTAAPPDFGWAQQANQVIMDDPLLEKPITEPDF